MSTSDINTFCEIHLLALIYSTSEISIPTEVSQILVGLRLMTSTINSRIEIRNCGGGGGKFTFIAVRT